MLLVGCNISTSATLDIGSSVEYYQLTMSSVPGLPIELSHDADNAIMNITSDSGQFLDWQGQVTALGSKVELDDSEATIYWVPDSDAEIIWITIHVVDGNKNLVSRKVHIEKTEKGYRLETMEE